MKYLAILKPDEDGNPLKIISHYCGQDVDLDQIMEDYGIRQWLSEKDYIKSRGPMHWGTITTNAEETGLLMIVNIIEPVQEEVVTKWRIPE